jgi:hypothetical protein
MIGVIALYHHFGQMYMISREGREAHGLSEGRRWRHEQPDFRERLSPLGRPLEPATSETPQLVDAASERAQTRTPDVPSRGAVGPAVAHDDLEHPTGTEGVVALRREPEQQMREDIAAARAAGRLGGPSADLLPSGLDGSMPDPKETEELWR